MGEKLRADLGSSRPRSEGSWGFPEPRRACPSHRRNGLRGQPSEIRRAHAFTRPRLVSPPATSPRSLAVIGAATGLPAERLRLHLQDDTSQACGQLGCSRGLQKGVPPSRAASLRPPAVHSERRALCYQLRVAAASLCPGLDKLLLQEAALRPGSHSRDRSRVAGFCHRSLAEPQWLSQPRRGPGLSMCKQLAFVYSCARPAWAVVASPSLAQI